MGTPLERNDYFPAPADRVGGANARRFYWIFIAALLMLVVFETAASSFMSQATGLKDVRDATPLSDTDRSAVEGNVYYPSCSAARAAGAAPIYEGQPGYRPELDSDSDGIACEPHHRHRKR